MTIRAVLWDLGGVLVRTEDRSARRAWERRHGLAEGGLDDLIFGSAAGQQAARGLVPEEEVWRSAAQRLGLDDAGRERLRREFFSGDRLDEALMDYIRRLRPARRVGMITNAWRSVRPALERHWRIADAFDPLVISAEVGLLKPDPGIYQLALQALGLPAGQVLFVDDFAENVEGARAAGLQALQFTGPQAALGALRALLPDVG